jgi:hypothetical protein
VTLVRKKRISKMSVQAKPRKSRDGSRESWHELKKTALLGLRSSATSSKRLSTLSWYEIFQYISSDEFKADHFPQSCSQELDLKLHVIINREAGIETSTESDGLTSTYADSERFEASYFDHQSDGTIEFQQQLDSAHLEIENLKAKILDLESKNTAPITSKPNAESQMIEDLTKRNAELTAETKKAKADKVESELALEGKTAELGIATTKISSLEETLKIQKPLFDVGVKVRRGFLQSVKRVWANGQYITTHPPLDVNLIWDKNEAVHRGNYTADKSLFDLKILKTTKEKADFIYAYQIAENHDLSEHPGRLELVNCHGTLMACGFLTAYTHSKTEDERAMKCFDDCKPLFSDRELDTAELKRLNISLNKSLKVVRKITEDAVKKEQIRMFR